MICCENIIKYCGRCISLSQESLLYLQGRFKSPYPRRSGFAIGMATLTCINKHCMSCLLLCSIASTVPKCRPTSSANWGQTISKGAPHICTHIETDSTFFAVIPLPICAAWEPADCQTSMDLHSKHVPTQTLSWTWTETSSSRPKQSAIHPPIHPPIPMPSSAYFGPLVC